VNTVLSNYQFLKEYPAPWRKYISKLNNTQRISLKNMALTYPSNIACNVRISRGGPPNCYRASNLDSLETSGPIKGGEFLD
jgi:hypothetical protein